MAAQNMHWGNASKILRDACNNGTMKGATIYARQGRDVLHECFGSAKSIDVSFLLGSITKPIVVAALMTLFDKGRFSLQDRVSRFLPEFVGELRSQVEVRHLLTHTCGLPDQLPNNHTLRASHASLDQFVEAALKLSPSFEPGSKYQYSSMGILLAAEMAQRLSNRTIQEFVVESILKPIGMHNSSLGIGGLTRDHCMDCETEFAAPEAGGGSIEAKNWDWNSPYWRQLGAPWGGAHASAQDVAKFLEEFVLDQGRVFDRRNAKRIVENHNPSPLKPRGLGFDVQLSDACPRGSISSFGHTGSTGTVAWHDPARDITCVILTTLPATAVAQHPRTLASRAIDLLD